MKVRIKTVAIDGVAFQIGSLTFQQKDEIMQAKEGALIEGGQFKWKAILDKSMQAELVCASLNNVPFLPEDSGGKWTPHVLFKELDDTLYLFLCEEVLAWNKLVRADTAGEATAAA